MTEQTVPIPDLTETPPAETEAPDTPVPPAADPLSAAAEDAALQDPPAEDAPGTPGSDLSDEGLTGASSDGSAAVSLLAGLIGCIAGMILCALGGGMTSTLGRFLFLLIPLAIGAANLLFRGSRRVPALVITAAFAALGTCLVPSFTAAAETAGNQGLSVLSVPLIALSKVPTANYFTGFALDTAHVFPVLFAAIGVLIAWEMYKKKTD